MVTASDLIPLAFNPDMTQAGISIVIRSLAGPRDRETGLTTHDIREQVAGVVMELAFRRLISQEHIPHRYLETAPFTAPGQRDITIGGRRCTIIHNLITHKSKIREVRLNSVKLLEAQVNLPPNPALVSNPQDDDLYVFGFIFGLVTPNIRAIQKALSANQEIFLIHPFPFRWHQPDRWQSLGDLVLKNESKHSVHLKICGQDSERKFQTKSIDLQPRERAQVCGDFYTASILFTRGLPDGVVGIHSPVLANTHRVQPTSWGNIWIYGIQIILAGYITCGELWNRVKTRPVSSLVKQSRPTKTTDDWLSVADLYPLPDLFKRAKAWQTR